MLKTAPTREPIRALLIGSEEHDPREKIGELTRELARLTDKRLRDQRELKELNRRIEITRRSIDRIHLELDRLINHG